MKTQWIPLPAAPPLASRTTPILIERRQVETVRDDLVAVGALVREIELADAAETADIFAALKKVLIFPTWCGSGWDSFEDAFEEIRSESQFPLFLLVDGLHQLLERHTHLALETVVRLAEAERAFSLAGVQFVVIFVGDRWPG